MAIKYISRHTGEQLDNAVDAATPVVANPLFIGEAPDLSTIEIAGIVYKIPQSGSSLTVDDALSTTSTNPVQNKVITQNLNTKQAILSSGVNIKTVNGSSLLGSGDLTVDSLPPVTILDAGKFLQVDEQGHWGVAAIDVYDGEVE